MVRTVAEPAWTANDRALMLALQLYESGLCRCGQPRKRAWHPDMSGYYDEKFYQCHACSAQQGKPIYYPDAVDSRPADDELPDVPYEVSAPESMRR